jgi:hypothetical protein
MANVLTTRPIVVDTAMAQDFLTAISATARPLRVRKIVWVNPGAAGAGAFTITDGSTAANVVAQGNAPAASLNPNQQIDFGNPVMWKNFKVTALTGGGKLLIYC